MDKEPTTETQRADADVGMDAAEVVFLVVAVLGSVQRTKAVLYLRE